MEALARRDRWIVLGGLIGVTALAWVYTIVLAGHDMESHLGGMAGMHHAAWGAADLALTFLMWVVMMVAMMLPTAAPMVLALAAISLTLASAVVLRRRTA